MTSPKEHPPKPQERRKPDAEPAPGSNAVQHEPDPGAEATPDGDPKHVPSSPYTTGND
jgi:hypothetical protein